MAEDCRFSIRDPDKKLYNNNEECICFSNVLIVFISLILILADFTTDLLVFAEYCNNGLIFWAMSTLVFIIFSNIIVNVFSLRWYIFDGKSTVQLCLSHGFLVGVLERYITFLHKVFTCKHISDKDTEILEKQRNDLSILHFVYVFTGTVPQVILQINGILFLSESYHTKAFSILASVSSVIWGFTIYLFNTTKYSKYKFKWSAYILKLTWNIGMLISRLASILMFTILFGIWTLVPFGLHWTAMTFWIILQKTTFCANKMEETFYNVIKGFIHCFYYIDSREGHTKSRLILYYSIIAIQNFGCILLYFLMPGRDNKNHVWLLIMIYLILIGTIIGLGGIGLYSQCYFNDTNNDISDTQIVLELNNKKDLEKSLKGSTKHLRTTKGQIDGDDKRRLQSEDNSSGGGDKYLLDSTQLGSPVLDAKTICENSMEVSSIDIHTVENTPQPALPQKYLKNINENNFNNLQSKKKKLLPPNVNTRFTLDTIESHIDEITANYLNANKRRGICSSDELRDNILVKPLNSDIEKYLKNDQDSEISHDTEGSNKKTSSDSIDMDLDLSFSDINSSDINTFNENIVQKLCLSALKNIKVGNQDADIENIQRIALDILNEMYMKKGKTIHSLKCDSTQSKHRDLETPTENLSVHDYENICAVNIAREAWGLRSWNGYWNIENWLHDGSVVRDRRRDTLTSGSSEISSCISQDLKNAILAAPAFAKKSHTYSNVFVKSDKNQDYVNTFVPFTNDEIYSTSQCADIRDISSLEPILEELDDLCDLSFTNDTKINSKSSLVATIDEMRKAMITNSPNFYSRKKPCQSIYEESRNKTKYKSQTLGSGILVEKENNLNVDNNYSYDLHLKTDEVTANKSDGNANYKNSNSDTQRRFVTNDLKYNDIDVLWKYVSDNSMTFSSTEDLTPNRISTSLQSLIKDDLVKPGISKVPKNNLRNQQRKKNFIMKDSKRCKILSENN